jgi:uncharacterized membrane protein YcaP (DUF421 family)
MKSLEDLFGTSSELTIFQMSLRAAVVFLLTIVMLRIAGRRAFSQKNSLDVCTIVLLGAILSRAVVGASPFLPTMGAGIVIVSLHRLIALIGTWYPTFDKIINGTERILVNDSFKNEQQMKSSLITDKDLVEAIRKKIGSEDLEQVQRAILERNGEITIIPKN